MLTDERRAEFQSGVTAAKLKTDQGKSDGWVRIIGIILMVVGLVGAFLVYNISLTQSDLRDLLSSQILAIALAVLALVGAAMFVASALSRVLRLWLLRQLVESQAHVDQLADAVRSPRV